ncbi:MAG: lamin tail domain-containing protein [Chloroflexota bacterium]
MKNRSSWFTFILLNIIVSATVTFAVLYYYDNYYKSSPPPTLSASVPSPTSVEQVTIGDVQLEIVSVIGSGVAETEIAVLQNKGEDAVLLTNWILRNGDGTSYTFPQVKMFKDGIVQVHTSAGADTPVDLYWGRSQPVWHSGDVASLFDTQGNLRATYLIP